MELSTLQAIGPVLAAAATTTLAFLTFFSVRAARAMAREMYESRLAHFRPLLYPILRLPDSNHESHAVLIRNVGPGPAMDIDVCWEGRVRGRDHVPFLGPDQKVELAACTVDSGNDREEVSVSVRFKDIFNNPITVRTKYRLENGSGKRLIFPADTVMEGEIIGCGRRR